MFIKEILLEGGNVWPDITPFRKEEADLVLSNLQKVMPKGIKLIKVGSAGHKAVSGDMDVMVDENDIIKYFKTQIDKITKELKGSGKKQLSPTQIARSLLKQYFEKKGFRSEEHTSELQ